jgi:hypothetical protein
MFVSFEGLNFYMAAVFILACVEDMGITAFMHVFKYRSNVTSGVAQAGWLYIVDYNERIQAGIIWEAEYHAVWEGMTAWNRSTSNPRFWCWVSHLRYCGKKGLWI